jgi:hypothetical protein
MSMCGRDHIRARRMDLGVDGKGSGVDRPIAVDHLTTVIDQNQILGADHLEVHAKWVDPKMVKVLGIASRDVTSQTLIKSEMPEQSEGGGQPLLAVPPFVLDGGEGGELRWDTV